METRHHPGAYLCVVVVALAAGVFTAPALRGAEEPADPAALEKPVKDFELNDVITGKSVKLSDHKGKVVVLLWYSPFCSACPAYDARVKEFVESYRKDEKTKDKVVLLAISSNSTDDEQTLRSYVKKEELNFPMLRDADAQVAGYFGIEQTATFLVIDAHGVLRYRGGFDDSPTPDLVRRHYVKDAVDAILADKKFLLRETFSFG